MLLPYDEDNNKDSDNNDLGCLLFAIAMVLMMAFCSHGDKLDRIEQHLQDINHEVRMINIRQ
jgi:hypothetical protein